MRNSVIGAISNHIQYKYPLDVYIPIHVLHDGRREEARDPAGGRRNGIPFGFPRGVMGTGKTNRAIGHWHEGSQNEGKSDSGRHFFLRAESPRAKA